MLALAVGTILAVGALAYVLFPLLAGASPAIRPRPTLPAELRRGVEHEAVAALREIEFDRVTGKLSDSDYEELKTRYTERALDALRTPDAAGPDDLAEALVLASRARIRGCGACGPRPEPDAVYCSRCGRFLPGACGSCGASVSEPGASYCTMCGRQLAA